MCLFIGMAMTCIAVRFTVYGSVTKCANVSDVYVSLGTHLCCVFNLRVCVCVCVCECMCVCVCACACVCVSELFRCLRHLVSLPVIMRKIK